MKTIRCETRSPSRPPAADLRFREPSIFYERTKDGVSAREILRWPVLTSRETITAPVIREGQEHQNFASEAQPAVRARACSDSSNKQAVWKRLARAL